MQGEKRILTNQTEPTRPITADMAAEIETAAIDVKEAASLISVMQQAFFNGAPDPELAAEALNSVSTSLLRIYKNLDSIARKIYKKGEA